MHSHKNDLVTSCLNNMIVHYFMNVSLVVLYTAHTNVTCTCSVTPISCFHNSLTHYGVISNIWRVLKKTIHLLYM